MAKNIKSASLERESETGGMPGSKPVAASAPTGVRQSRQRPVPKVALNLQARAQSTTVNDKEQLTTGMRDIYKNFIAHLDNLETEPNIIITYGKELKKTVNFTELFNDLRESELQYLEESKGIYLETVKTSILKKREYIKEEIYNIKKTLIKFINKNATSLKIAHKDDKILRLHDILSIIIDVIIHYTLNTPLPIRRASVGGNKSSSSNNSASSASNNSASSASNNSASSAQVPPVPPVVVTSKSSNAYFTLLYTVCFLIIVMQFLPELALNINNAAPGKQIISDICDTMRLKRVVKDCYGFCAPYETTELGPYCSAGVKNTLMSLHDGATIVVILLSIIYAAFQVTGPLATKWDKLSTQTQATILNFMKTASTIGVTTIATLYTEHQYRNYQNDMLSAQTFASIACGAFGLTVGSPIILSTAAKNIVETETQRRRLLPPNYKSIILKQLKEHGYLKNISFKGTSTGADINIDPSKIDEILGMVADDVVEKYINRQKSKSAKKPAATTKKARARASPEEADAEEEEQEEAEEEESPPSPPVVVKRKTRSAK